MATTDDIGWGSYRQYEGPFYRGKHRFVLPEEPTENDKVLAVVTATEGGRYDAINMYDGPPVISSGLIQFIEGGQRSVSAMIGSLDDEPDADGVFNDFMQETISQGYQFSYDGKWYFTFDDGETHQRVDTRAEQDELFRRGSNGEKGTWSDEAKLQAIEWASAIASIWEHPAAQRAQREFTLPLLEQFAFGDSRKMILYAVSKDTEVAHAFVAAYLSFAVNNPTRANKHLALGLEKARMESKASSEMWSVAWLIEILKELTFGPNIAIYPHRYNAIRGPLEKLFGINLPDFADELQRWTEDTGLIAISTKELQKSLLSLGEDLGPKGADGQYGRKTRNAVLNLEVRMQVPEEFRDGMVDEYTYPALEEALRLTGLKQLRESS
jgi:hypothetical protein